MTIRADLYQLVLRFPRLFPDPTLFEDPLHVANRYLENNGLPKEKSDLVCQSTEEIGPVDDSGKPSVPSGTAKYRFEGRVILAEYMSNANVRLDYADFGTGLTSNDHSRLWSKGKIGELRFELRDLKHQSQTVNIPAVSELYAMLKDRARPNTLSTLELDNVPATAFKPTLDYIGRMLRNMAKNESIEVEVYAARDLSDSEKSALETRLTRTSTGNTVFVILSHDTGSKPSRVVG